MNGISKSDYLLAGLLTAAGAFLMAVNITADPDDASLAHPQSTTSWLMLPVFLLVTVPILWRRRNILAVLAVTVAVTAVHVLAFGWVTRCGVGIPLAAALAYAVARFARGRRDQILGLAGVLAVLLLVLVRDASIGPVADGLVIALPATALLYAIGLIVRHRAVAHRPTAEQPTAEHAAV